MEEQAESTYTSDPAAIFACALSIWETFKKKGSTNKNLNLSQDYNGMDEFMREAMRVSELFESWACEHVEFKMLNDVWPYLLEGQFGNACARIDLLDTLRKFREEECLRVALMLGLPIKLNDKLPIPVDVKAFNPNLNSSFKEFRIQTVRHSVESESTEPYTQADDPFDPDFEPPYFGLYGVGSDGLVEHIADRATYLEATGLAKKLIPEIEFPATPFLFP